MPINRAWRYKVKVIKLSASIFVGVFILSGCGDKGGGSNGGTSNENSIIETGFSLIKGRPVGYSALCDRIENMEVIDRVNKTAGALKYPAYIIGYSFDCLSSISGKERTTLYIAFMENKDKGTYECIHWNKDKNTLVDPGGWGMCGGLNQ
jgi:hypothetical protein